MSKQSITFTGYEAETIVNTLDAISAILKSGHGASGVDLLRKRGIIHPSVSTAAILDILKPIRKKFNRVGLEGTVITENEE